jgi:hypothetical protein
MGIRTHFTTRLARLATSVVHGVHTMNVTHVLVGFAAVLALRTTATLVLFSFVYDVRTSTFVNFVRSFVMDYVAMRCRTVSYAVYRTTLFVLCTGVVMMNTMFNMTMVMSFVTLHGSLLKSYSTG